MVVLNSCGLLQTGKYNDYVQRTSIHNFTYGNIKIQEQYLNDIRSETTRFQRTNFKFIQYSKTDNGLPIVNYVNIQDPRPVEQRLDSLLNDFQDLEILYSYQFQFIPSLFLKQNKKQLNIFQTILDQHQSYYSIFVPMETKKAETININKLQNLPFLKMAPLSYAKKSSKLFGNDSDDIVQNQYLIKSQPVDLMLHTYAINLLQLKQMSIHYRNCEAFYGYNLLGRRYGAGVYYNYCGPQFAGIFINDRVIDQYIHFGQFNQLQILQSNYCRKNIVEISQKPINQQKRKSTSKNSEYDSDSRQQLLQYQSANYFRNDKFFNFNLINQYSNQSVTTQLFIINNSNITLNQQNLTNQVNLYNFNQELIDCEFSTQLQIQLNTNITYYNVDDLQNVKVNKSFYQYNQGDNQMNQQLLYNRENESSSEEIDRVSSSQNIQYHSSSQNQQQYSFQMFNQQVNKQISLLKERQKCQLFIADILQVKRKLTENQDKIQLPENILDSQIQTPSQISSKPQNLYQLDYEESNIAPTRFNETPIPNFLKQPQQTHDTDDTLNKQQLKMVKNQSKFINDMQKFLKYQNQKDLLINHNNIQNRKKYINRFDYYFDNKLTEQEQWNSDFNKFAQHINNQNTNDFYMCQQHDYQEAYNKIQYKQQLAPTNMILNQFEDIESITMLNENFNSQQSQLKYSSFIPSLNYYNAEYFDLFTNYKSDSENCCVNFDEFTQIIQPKPQEIQVEQQQVQINEKYNLNSINKSMPFNQSQLHVTMRNHKCFDYDIQRSGQLTHIIQLVAKSNIKYKQLLFYTTHDNLQQGIEIHCASGIIFKPRDGIKIERPYQKTNYFENNLLFNLKELQQDSSEFLQKLCFEDQLHFISNIINFTDDVIVKYGNLNEAIYQLFKPQYYLTNKNIKIIRFNDTTYGLNMFTYDQNTVQIQNIKIKQSQYNQMQLQLNTQQIINQKVYLNKLQQLYSPRKSINDNNEDNTFNNYEITNNFQVQLSFQQNQQQNAQITIEQTQLLTNIIQQYLELSDDSPKVYFNQPKFQFPGYVNYFYRSITVNTLVNSNLYYTDKYGKQSILSENLFQYNFQIQTDQHNVMNMKIQLQKQKNDIQYSKQVADQLNGIFVKLFQVKFRILGIQLQKQWLKQFIQTSIQDSLSNLYHYIYFQQEITQITENIQQQQTQNQQINSIELFNLLNQFLNKVVFLGV